MFRALLCPSSGARDYTCVITAYGVQCLGCWWSEVRCRTAGYASRIRVVARRNNPCTEPFCIPHYLLNSGNRSERCQSLKITTLLNSSSYKIKGVCQLSALGVRKYSSKCKITTVISANTIFFHHRFDYTDLLTPWSRVLFEKLTGSQLIEKFPAFYGTRRFIITFTSARHLSLS
jgi:hypothetical protein